MIDSRLPLTDIHRHLDGNIRAQTILDLGRQFNLALPANELEALRPHVQITHAEPDLVSFLQKLDWGVAVLGDLDACRRVAYENVEDAAQCRSALCRTAFLAVLHGDEAQVAGGWRGGSGN